jgi:pentatricopeptide repeat protein
LDEYATNCMLDLMVRSGRIDEARAWATELLADADFLAGKDDLRDTLDHVLARLR